MKIRQRMLFSHIIVGILPVILAFSILTFIFYFQYNNQVKRNLDSAIEEIKDKIERNMENYRVYSYFFKRAAMNYEPVIKDYYFNNFTLRIDQYNMDILEFTFSNKIIRRYFSNQEFGYFSTSPEFCDFMWDFLSKPQFNSEFRTSFSDIVSNQYSPGMLVIRSCSIIYDYKKLEKNGLAIVSIPFNQVYLNNLTGKNPDIIVFIETMEDIIFSKETLNNQQTRNKIKQINFDVKYHHVTKLNDNKYYILKIPLYKNKDKTIAYVGILYGFQSINKTMALFQWIGILSFCISILIGGFIALYFSNNITIPVLKLNEMVNRFHTHFEIIESPKDMPDEISQLQKSFTDMSKSILEYRTKLNNYNDQLTQEIEKKTKELMSQIRGLVTINNFSSYINTQVVTDGAEFLQNCIPLLKDIYKLKYISIFIKTGNSYNRYSTLLIDTPDNQKNYISRINSLENHIIEGKKNIGKRFSWFYRDSLVNIFPLLISDEPNHILFFITNKKSRQLIQDTFETIINIISMKMHSINMQKSKIESEKLASIGQFASTVIHDIKNPLTVIKSMVEALKDPDYSEEEKTNYYIILKSEIDRLTNMLNDILDFSKGRLNLMKEAIDIDEFILKLLNTYQKILGDKKILVHTNLKADCRIFIDQYRIWRSIGNIIQNSLDVLSVSGTLTLSTSSTSDSVEISIRDNGPGIPKEVQAQLFQPFFSYGKKNGTGLGLSIVKKIIESHNGELWFETTTGKGTTFFIRLPRNQSLYPAKA